jgi:hypothetical protein
MVIGSECHFYIAHSMSDNKENDSSFSIFQRTTVKFIEKKKTKQKKQHIMLKSTVT